MSRNIDVALLRTFVAVAETGGMTAASRLLNLTQAAISQQIRRLEDQLGQQLFDRDRRPAALTPPGERLHAFAQRMLALNDEAWGMMTSPDFEGEVKFGVPHDIVRPYIPPILKGFAQHWPSVRVTLVCLTTLRLCEMLERGEIDLTLTTENEPGKAGGELLMPNQLVWVGARGGEAHKRRPLPVSVGDGTCAFRAASLKALAGIDVDWRITCETSDFSPYCAAIEADLAVAPMLALTVPRHLQVLGAEEGLPTLPVFHINMRLPRAGLSKVAEELARFVRAGFMDALPDHRAAWPWP
jgi:DNA-binding transcriptional LysR family regulator